MKNVFVLILLLISFSSCDKKTILLPEVQNAKISEVIDVSPAYIFYDITKPDSTDFNRRNLIGTTNWLVNVDKRLTLKQAIPHIQFLEDKRRNAKMHKNENARNYFTCNDTARNNLGFIDFTDVVYSFKIIDSLSEEYSISTVISFSKNLITVNDDLIELKQLSALEGNLTLNFSSSLTFEEYIAYKSSLLKIDSPNITIMNHEFIY